MISQPSIHIYPVTKKQRDNKTYPNTKPEVIFDIPNTIFVISFLFLLDQGFIGTLYNANDSAVFDESLSM